MTPTCTLQEIMDATGVNRHDARARLRCVQPAAAPSGKKGRPSKVYPLSAISEDLRSAVEAYRERKKDAFAADSPSLDPIKLSPEEASLCMAKTSLVFEFRKFLDSFGQKNIAKAEDEFVRLYSLGEAWRELFSRVGPVSIQTIRRWNATLKAHNDDPFSLADRRGKHRLGKTIVSERQGEILAACYCTPNRPNFEQAIRVARIRTQAEGIDDRQTNRTLRNWLNKYIEGHFAEATFLRDGEKARQQECEPSILRDWNRIEVGDIFFADGKTLNIELLNPRTGKGKRYHLIQFLDAKSNMPVGYEISCSEDTQSIAIALYRAILNLGKIPKVVYLDNGKAFRGRFFSGVKDLSLEPFVGVFKQLGIQVIFAKPYNARAKTIERFHRTMDEFERRIFSFVGASITDKPARLKRAEWWHKDEHAAQFQGRLLRVEEFSIAYDHWLAKEYGERPQKGHLDGRTPMEVFWAGRGPGFNEEQLARLRVLLSALAVRKISRHGIKLPGCPTLFYHPDLYGRQLQSAIVRYDWKDRSRIFVYDSSGEFICIAEPRKTTHPAARPLGSPEDVEVVASEIEKQRRLAKTTHDAARAMYEGHILPECNRQRESMGLQGVIPPASIKAKQDEEPAPAEYKLTREEIAAAVAELESASEERKEPAWEEVKNHPDVLRFVRNVQVQATQHELPVQESVWLFQFENGEFYKRYQKQLEDITLGVALKCEGA